MAEDNGGFEFGDNFSMDEESDLSIDKKDIFVSEKKTEETSEKDDPFSGKFESKMDFNDFVDDNPQPFLEKQETILFGEKNEKEENNEFSGEKDESKKDNDFVFSDLETNFDFGSFEETNEKEKETKVGGDDFSLNPSNPIDPRYNELFSESEKDAKEVEEKLKSEEKDMDISIGEINPIDKINDTIIPAPEFEGKTQFKEASFLLEEGNSINLADITFNEGNNEDEGEGEGEESDEEEDEVGFEIEIGDIQKEKEEEKKDDFLNFDFTINKTDENTKKINLMDEPSNFSGVLEKEIPDFGEELFLEPNEDNVSFIAETVKKNLEDRNDKFQEEVNKIYGKKSESTDSLSLSEDEEENPFVTSEEMFFPTKTQKRNKPSEIKESKMKELKKQYSGLFKFDYDIKKKKREKTNIKIEEDDIEQSVFKAVRRGNIFDLKKNLSENPTYSPTSLVVNTSIYYPYRNFEIFKIILEISKIELFDENNHLKEKIKESTVLKEAFLEKFPEGLK